MKRFLVGEPSKGFQVVLNALTEGKKNNQFEIIVIDDFKFSVNDILNLSKYIQQTDSIVSIKTFYPI